MYAPFPLVRGHRAALATAVGFLAATGTSVLADKPSGPDYVVPPGFMLSRQDVTAAVEQGIAAAKEDRPEEELIAGVRQEPVWVSGKRGDAKDCSVWFTSLGGADLRLRARRAWDKRTSVEVSKDLPHETSVVASLDFDVLLNSIPRNPKLPWHQDPSANAADVRVQQFEIADDRGHTILLPATTRPDLSAVGLSDVISLESKFASAAALPGGRDEVRRTPATLEFGADATRPFYQARYHVHASLWDREGRLRVSSASREIRLIIVTETGKMTATFALPAPGAQRGGGTTAGSLQAANQ